MDTFTVWATSDAHVIREALAESCDPRAVPRESLAIALEQADGPEGFFYDIGLHLGDLLDYGHETLESFHRYLAQLDRGAKGRHAWYHVGGNNDENSVLNDGVAIDNEYYRKTIDPVGEFTAVSGIDNNRRPYPVTGTYERYAINVGNMRMLFLHDRNDLPAPYGRGGGGFYVDGAVTEETYRWLVAQIITYPDRILVVCCHHPLKDTTIGSAIDDSWRGRFMTEYHGQAGPVPDPTNRLQSVLHQIYDLDPFDSHRFHHLLDQNHGVLDVWLSGHVHHRVDQWFEGKGKYAVKYGSHHLNVGTLCRYRHHLNLISAQSTVLTFRKDDSECRSQVYVHDHPSIPSGFYAPESRPLNLKKAFSKAAVTPGVVTAPDNIAELAVTQAETGPPVLRWRNAGTGLLIVRSPQGPPDFEPVDGEVYAVGDSAGNGHVAFIGVNESFVDDPMCAGENRCYRAFAYNAGSGRIRYCQSAPRGADVTG